MRSSIFVAAIALGSVASSASAQSAGEPLKIVKGGQCFLYSDLSGIRPIETGLGARGYNPGKIDGVVDPQFIQALSQFQTDELRRRRDKEPTPKPTPGVLDETTARWLGVDFQGILKTARPVAKFDTPSTEYPNAKQFIDRSYENSQTGVEEFGPPEKKR
jgi:hypothetical protein